MSHDLRADLDFEAENRRLRRAGLEPVEIPRWPLHPDLYELEMDFTRLCIDNAAVMPGSFVRRFFSLHGDEASLRFFGDTLARHRALLDSGAAIIAEARAHVARARGTREPGDDDGQD